ncbi:hypothetical protein [Nocardioides salsibiostraticola]
MSPPVPQNDPTPTPTPTPQPAPAYVEASLPPLMASPRAEQAAALSRPPAAADVTPATTPSVSPTVRPIDASAPERLVVEGDRSIERVIETRVERPSPVEWNSQGTDPVIRASEAERGHVETVVFAQPVRPAPTPTAEVAAPTELRPPAVHIHIGRVEVRADNEQPAAGTAPTAAPAVPNASVLSLSEFLQGRTRETS